jgi:hypothetical protein
MAERLRFYVGTYATDARTLRLLEEGLRSIVQHAPTSEVVVVNCSSPKTAEVTALVAGLPGVRMVTVPNHREAAVISCMIAERDPRVMSIFLHDTVKMMRPLALTDLVGAGGTLWHFDSHLPDMDVPFFAAAAGRMGLKTSDLCVGSFGGMCYASAPVLQALADMGWDAHVTAGCTTRAHGMSVERLLALALQHQGLHCAHHSLQGSIFEHAASFTTREHLPPTDHRSRRWFSKAWSGR